LAPSARREKRRRRPGAARFAAAPDRAGQGKRKKKGKGKGEADRWGPHVSERKTKRKRKEAVWAGAGRRLMGRWAVGLKGGKVSFFFFFFKLFLNQTFLFKFKPNSFKLFLKNFINFLEVTQATKSYAKSNNDAQPLVVSILIKFSLIF
jgi:hypothetical protein